MKAAVLTEIRKIEIKSIKKPEIRDDEVLIKVKSTGICGSDLHAYRGIHPFRKPPVVLGHELSGNIAETGKRITKFKIGDKVTVEPHIGCGKCEYCLSGNYNLCKEKKVPGIGEWTGTFAEYFAAPEKTIYKLSDDLSFDEGALIEPLAVGVHAVRQSGIKLGDSVAILGAGTIGLMSLIAAKQVGVTKIFITDFLDYNLEKAKKFGADYTINPSRENVLEKVKKILPYGVSKVIITAAFRPVWEEAVKISKKSGNICVVGMFDKEVQVDFLNMLMAEKSVSTSWVYLREDFIRAIEITKKIDLNPLITHKLPLYKALEGLKKMDERKENVIKIILSVD